MMKCINGHMAGLFLLVFLNASSTHAQSTDYPLQVWFDDGSGDSTAPADLASMRLAIDNRSGDYEIILSSTEVEPFQNDFQVNLNLFNPDVGTRECAVGQFVLNLDYTGVDPAVQELTFEGSNEAFKAWSPGDRVATTSEPFDAPDCSTSFTSELAGLPSTEGNWDQIDDRGNFFAVIRQSGPLFVDRFEPAVPQPNQLPVAGPSRTVQTFANQTETIVLTGSDADGESLTYEIIDAPESGSLANLQSTGTTSASVDYTPAADFIGEDSLSYRAGDGNDVSGEATITITVEAFNEPPQLADDSATVDEDNSVTVPVLDNDIDPDGLLDPATVSIQVDAANGATSVNATTGEVTYTPSSNYAGSDSFVYRVCDDGVPDPVKCAEAEVTVDVAAINDAPQASGLPRTIAEDRFLFQFDVLYNDSDVDGNIDPSTLSIVTPPENGTANPASVELSPGDVLYGPDEDFFGEDTFVYEVCDDGNPTPVKCDQATVTMTVYPVNDAPTFTFQGDVETSPNASVEIVDWASSDPGAPNESDQSVVYEVRTSFQGLFSEQPSVSPDGTLTFTTQTNGVATVYVKVVDDGGVANGGSDTSAEESFEISSQTGGCPGCIR